MNLDSRKILALTVPAPTRDDLIVELEAQIKDLMTREGGEFVSPEIETVEIEEPNG